MKRIDMHKITIGIVFGVLITSILFLGTISAIENQKPPVTWMVKLPSYIDHSPRGLPDFDQRQDSSWYSNFPFIGSIPTWCGPTAAADLLWYLDSIHEDGTVGDGVSNWDLVPNGCYSYLSNDDFPMGVVVCHADDHTWENWANNGEPAVAHDLIECIADLSGTDSWGKIYNLAGNNQDSIVIGLNSWISNQGLSDYYNVNLIHKPDSDDIKDAIQHGYGAMFLCEPWAPSWLSATAPHFAAIQGYIQTGEIKRIIIRDPADGLKRDAQKYNDAANVLLSIEYINSSYLPRLSNLMIEDYLWNFLLKKTADAFITYLIVIEET